MITSQHRNILANLIDNQDANGIHDLMNQLSVADQKQLKLVLVKTLANRKSVTCSQSMALYAALIPQNLNLYYKSFLLAAPAYKKDNEFWENLNLLEPLGDFLSQTKAYYRQNLIVEWTNGLKSHHPVEELFRIMKVTNPMVQLNYLIESDSLYGYYLFMILAIRHDIDLANLSKLVRKLLLPNDKLKTPQNMREDTANFLTHHFNIQDIHYPFHRTLDATMFAFAEKNYESFLKVIIPASRIQSFLNSL